MSTFPSGDPDPFSGILEGLTSSEWSPRVEALRELSRALTRTSPHEAPEGLVRALSKAARDPKWEVRKAVADLLAIHHFKGRGELLEALSDLAEDRNRWVRRAASDARLRQRRSLQEKNDWELSPQSLDPLLGYISSRLKDLDQKTLSPRALLQISEEAGEKYYAQLGADMAHELRTAVAPIEGFVVSLQEHLSGAGPKSEKAEQFLERILARVRFLLRIVKDLSDLTAGAPPLSEDVALSAILEESLTIARDQVSGARGQAEKSICRLEVPEGLALRAYPGRLARAFANLIGNALLAMKDGGTLTIRGRREGEGMAVEVHDTGCGMAEEEIENAFLRFRTSRRSEGGTGLGLPIAKKIIEEHGGTIHLQSRLGQGTSVEVWIPEKAGMKGEGS